MERDLIMTAIKQVAVTSSGHVQNLGRYINDERSLMRDSQHILIEDKWAQEMEATREAYGHNKQGRAGAATTYMYHQVIAFNPDECSCNGGKMTPERCMEFARDWVCGRYPAQEAVWVLHREHCKADGTSRYAVHIGINRTNLETGNRLCEGRGEKAKRDRAQAMRALDAKWQLRQMVKGVRNSKVHAMQPSRAEKEMRARGCQSDKAYIREQVRTRVREISREAPVGNRMTELAKRLRCDGIDMSISKSRKRVQFQRKGSSFKVGGSRLGRGFSLKGLMVGLGMKAYREMEQAMTNEIDR